MKWYSIIFVSIVIEGIITYLKTVIKDKTIQWAVIASMCLGIGCALAFGLDLFAVAGITANIPHVGQVLTGVLLSRGSNYIYEIINKLTDAATTVASLEIPTDETNIEGHEDSGVM